MTAVPPELQAGAGGVPSVAGKLDPLEDLNVDQELQLEAQQGAARDEEYRQIQERLEQELAKQDSTTQARVQSIVQNMDDPIDDSPEVVEDIIQAVIGDPKEFNSNEAADFFRLVNQQTKAEWTDFQRQHPGMTKGEATRTLPPRYFAAPLLPAQMDSLIAANKSPLRPNVGVARARIHYRYKDGQSYSMLREFAFNQSAQSAIQEVVERVQTVLSLPSYGSPPAQEFMFKVLGRYEFLYGSEQMINFRYIRDCLMKHLDVELHVSRLPFPSSVLSNARFTPSFGLSTTPTTTSTQNQNKSNNNRNENDPDDNKNAPATTTSASAATSPAKGLTINTSSSSIIEKDSKTSAAAVGDDLQVDNTSTNAENNKEKVDHRIGISNICSTWADDDEDDPSISVWESTAPLELTFHELRNLHLDPERMKAEPLNLVTGQENAYVCVVIEITFGGQRLTSPQRTSWALCSKLLSADPKKGVPSSAMWNNFAHGHLVFDVPLSDLPREVRICCSIVGVRQQDFSTVRDVNAAALIDETETSTQTAGFARLASYFGVGSDEVEDDSLGKLPIFFISGVNFQLLDHRGHLKRGQLEVRMWESDQKWNPIGVSSANPDKHAPAMRLQLPDFAVPLVHPQSTAPPAYKAREMEHVHYENMRNLDISIRDNKIAQLRMVKNVLATDPLYELSEAEKILLWHFRQDLIRRPRALPKLLLAVDWRRPAAVHEGHQLMKSWAAMKPIDALELLDARFADTKVRGYAVSRLDTMPDFELTNVVLQLVQVLKYEPYHFSALARFLLRRALQSPQAIGHIFFWHLKAEMYNTAVSERHGLLLITFVRELQCRRDLLRQYSVDRLLLRAAMEVKNCKKHERLEFIRTKLDKLKFPPSFSLPLNPTMKCSGLEVFKCKVMDSKKLPLWLVFRNADPAGKNIYVIFKAGDDLRQDLLTLQMLELMDSMWKAAGLDLHMIPYGCVSTGDGTGMIEVVLRSDTIANITRSLGGGPTAAFSPEPIMAWLRKSNRTPAQVETCLWNFLFSTAGYCVATYILGIGDRHNDNIMVREDGTMFHIDFGHFLGNFKTKFGIKRETAPFIFTRMYAHMLGGPESTIYAHFCDVACYAFNVIRRQSNLLITLFMLMLSTGIPELQRPDDIKWLKTVLMPDADDAGAARHYRQLIQEALDNKRTLFNDYIHIVAH